MTTPNEGNVADIKRALLERKVRQRVAERAERERIVPVERTGKMAIADQQRFLWFLHQMVGGAPVYNVPFAMRLRGQLDVAALSGALRGIVTRHESLRTRFGDEHGVPFQAVDPPPETWDLPVTDGTEESIQDWIDEHVREEFDLRNGPPYRFGLLRLGPEDHVLSIVWHHIVIDGWSSRQFADELTTRYGDPDAEFEPITLHPADYAAWQRLWLLSDEPEKQVDFWHSSLDGMEPLELRGDRARPSAPTGAGRIHETRLPDDLARGIRELAKSEGISLLALTMAGYQVVMNRYTGQTDIGLGSVLSGRTRSETEPMMGFFANTVVVRGNLDGNPVFRDLAQTANDSILEAMANQDVPFGRLVGALKPERLPGRNPVVAHLFTLLPESMIARWRLPGVEVEMLTPQPETTRFDITFQINDLPDGGLGVWIEYSSELFDHDRIKQLVEHFSTVMTDALSRPGARVDALDIMPDSEYERVLTEWNPEPGERDGRVLHELVAARVAETPDAVAMRFQGQDLTYAQLDERSNRLAHALVDECKVVPGRVVGVLLERGFDLPAAELGVLKAGGAWLPLDPQYPPERLAYQLGDADVAAVVTTSDLADRVPEGVGRILLDTDALDGRETSPPSVRVAQKDAAYIIYTSGSTGTPKGGRRPASGRGELLHHVPADVLGDARRPDSAVLQPRLRCERVGCVLDTDCRRDHRGRAAPGAARSREAAGSAGPGAGDDGGHPACRARHARPVHVGRSTGVLHRHGAVRPRSGQQVVPSGARVPQRIRTHRGHGDVRGLPVPGGAVGRAAADRPGDGQSACLRAGQAIAAGAGRRTGRALHGGRRSCHRLSRPARADRREVPARPVHQHPGRAHVRHRRLGALERRRQSGVPWPGRPSGEAARSACGARRDRTRHRELLQRAAVRRDRAG